MREKVRSESRQRLLQAATVAFAQEGYVGANINRISRAAGFAKGTVYNYFPSKRALMLTLIDTIAEAHIDLGSCSQIDDKGQVWLDPKQMVTLMLEGLRRRGDQSENKE